MSAYMHVLGPSLHGADADGWTVLTSVYAAPMALATADALPDEIAAARAEDTAVAAAPPAAVALAAAAAMAAAVTLGVVVAPCARASPAAAALVLPPGIHKRGVAPGAN